MHRFPAIRLTCSLACAMALAAGMGYGQSPPASPGGDRPWKLAERRRAYSFPRNAEHGPPPRRDPWRTPGYRVLGQDPASPNPAPRAIRPPSSLPGNSAVPFGPSGPANVPTPVYPPGVYPGGAPLPAGPPGQIVPQDGEPLVPPNGFFQPFEDPTADLTAIVQETQTGRFSIGVGINSDAGILGNIVLDERNFAIARWPTSFADLFGGNAFRGDGQRFRMEAAPGDLVQRYTLSFQEPYLLDMPISFGVSGFFFTRFYEDWDEERLGARVNFGYQVRPDLTVGAMLRAESVALRDPRATPPPILRALGDNQLYSGQVSINNDTRDSAFLPTQGHTVEVAYEQVFGDFDYGRVTAEARKYFLLRERPDRSGRHVLSLRGRVGVSGNQTPVFENFFAGGYSTLRGFDFRGASPVDATTGVPVTVGGRFQLLGSVEYLLPITADDGFRMVFFCDFGTVEESVKLDADTFRVAPGLGFRIAVPGMGPAPIALDFAWAANKADTDETRVFSFNMGLLR